MLQRELRGSHRGTASAYLRYVPDDALELLPEIMWLATDLGLAHEVRDSLMWISRKQLSPRLVALLPRLLDEADTDIAPYDLYRCYAEMLAHVQTWEPLRMLVDRALISPDEDIREVGGIFMRLHGPLLDEGTSPA